MTTEQQKEKWETEFVTPSHSDTPFRGGKVTMQLAWFYSQCKKGNKVILAMPEGEIYSPKALESILSSQKQEWKEKLRKEIEKKIKDSLEKCEYCKGIVDVDCHHYDHFGNKALVELLKNL